MKTIRTTHVGSLPRPPEMMRKILRRQPVGKEALRQYLQEIVQRQLSLGIDFVSNGELPRMDYVRATAERISGFGGSAEAPIPKDLEDVPELSGRFGRQNGLITLNPRAPVKLPTCIAPLVYTGGASLREELDMLAGVYENLKAREPESESNVFFTAPSPGTVALFFENAYYPTDEIYLEQLAEVLKKEYETIAGYGFYLQIDCPDLAMGRHTRFKHLSDAEFLDRIHIHIRVLNQALAAVDPDRIRVHICWGNYPGTHHCDIDLAKILTPIGLIRARFISLEAANPRHAHEWTLFDGSVFPEDKVLMPGVIDTGTNTVEHPDLVARRIVNSVNRLGAERVIASTDCGFATTAGSASVAGEAAWLKLAALVEGARRASRMIS